VRLLRSSRTVCSNFLIEPRNLAPVMKCVIYSWDFLRVVRAVTWVRNVLRVRWCLFVCLSVALFLRITQPAQQWDRAGDWRKLHSEELHNLYFSPSRTIITLINSRRMRDVGLGRWESENTVYWHGRTWQDNIKMVLKEHGRHDAAQGEEISLCRGRRRL
jgi:hypothetical protein